MTCVMISLRNGRAINAVLSDSPLITDWSRGRNQLRWLQAHRPERRARTQDTAVTGGSSFVEGDGTTPSRTERQVLHTRGRAFKKETFPLARQL